MRTIHRAVIAGFTTICLPMAGLSPLTSSVILAIANRLQVSAEAQPLQAARDFAVPGVRIRSQPGTTAVVNGIGNPGDHVTVRRTVAGETVACPNGAPSTEWLHVTNLRTSVTGFVSACFV